MTYTFMLCLVLVAVARNSRWDDWLLIYWLAAALYMLVGLTMVWSGEQQQWAGALHWFFALLALTVGYQLGSTLTPELYRVLVGVVLILFILNFALCLAQLAGIPLSLYPNQLAEQLSEGRPIGTFGHSSTPGKFVLIMLILVLPALRFRDRATRRLAWWCIAIAVPLVALTLARANLAAIVMAIVLWMLLDHKAWTANPIRLLSLIAIFMASVPIVGATLNRFSTDPTGGGRAAIYHTGLTQLTMNLWSGTGPNFYVEDVGRWDAITASGYPLHNSFLYAVAELGLVGGVLFALPIFVVCAISIVDCFNGSEPSLWSKSYLVTFPGMIVVALTGWGMLSDSTLSLWYFVIGITAGAILHRHKSRLLGADVDDKLPIPRRTPRLDART
jgi:hypothetical protein